MNINIIKNTWYTMFWLFYSLNNFLLAKANSESLFVNDQTTIQDSLETKSLPVRLQEYMKFIMWFLYLIAIALALYWWFMILTASWDEEKVKKWKTILIQAWVWLVVIFLAWSIITWVLTFLDSSVGATA